MLLLFLLVPLILVLIAVWDWRRLNKSPALAEKPDYKQIERLEKELGLVSALSEEQFDRLIDKADPPKVAPRDPMLEFMSSTYDRAVQYVILKNKVGGYYTNTNPTQSIMDEMFKADT